MFNFKSIRKAGTNLLCILLLCSGSIVIDAEAQTLSGTAIEATEARRALPVEGGVVLDVVETVIERAAGTDSKIAGASIGGVLGALVASRGSQNWAKSAALSTGGALLGGLIASKASAEQIVSKQIIVRLDSGRTIALVQEDANAALAAGDLVYVVSGPQATRVVRRGNTPAHGTVGAAPTSASVFATQ